MYVSLSTQAGMTNKSRFVDKLIKVCNVEKHYSIKMDGGNVCHSPHQIFTA